MYHPARCLIALALLTCGVGLCSLAAAQERQTRKSPTGTITGKVTIQSKGAPRILIGLRCNEPDSQRQPTLKASTDENGHYRIDGVSPGTCVVAPVAPGFIVTDYAFNSPGKTVVIVEDETVDDIDFTLVAGGVITGKVVDADGRPLIEERITLLPSDSSNQGAQTASPRGPRTSQTDDRGIYRIFGVTAGHYKVGVSLSGDSGQVSPTRRPYQQTFYPDTTNFSKGTVVEVTEGGETSNIDIVVGRTLQTFSASGQIVDGETGRPVINRRWGLAQMSGSMKFDPSHYPANNQGEFMIETLLPGRYAVFVQPEPDADIFSEPVPFEIVDKNIDGLVIKTSIGASLAGRVVIEDADKTLIAKVSQMRLNVYVDSPGTAFPNWFSAAIKPDGSFYLRGLQPGTANINTVSASDPRLVKDLLILQTERDGIEQSRGIGMKAGEQITGLTVLVAKGTGVVSGEVQCVNGSLPAGAHVQVKVTRTDKVNPLTATDADVRGRFRIERLPPGSYWLDVDAFLPFAPGRRPPSVRQQFNIASGSVTEITITFDLSPAPPPNRRP
jgi:hypothetical protein